MPTTALVVRIPEYEKATSLEPGNADGWFDLGFMYKENHENDKAIAAFNKYLEINKGKDSGGAKRGRGMAIAGIVLGWVGIGIVGLLVLVWFVTVLTI